MCGCGQLNRGLMIGRKPSRGIHPPINWLASRHCGLVPRMGHGMHTAHRDTGYGSTCARIAMLLGPNLTPGRTELVAPPQATRLSFVMSCMLLKE
jgi:hypothetical protein